MSRPGSTTVSPYDLEANPWSEPQFPTCKTEQKSGTDDSFSLEAQQRVKKRPCHDLPALEFQKEGSCSLLVPSTQDRTGHIIE